MDKVVVHIHYGFYSAIKRNTFELVLEPTTQSEVRKRYISYINAYIQNLETRY